MVTGIDVVNNNKRALLSVEKDVEALLVLSEPRTRPGIHSAHDYGDCTLLVVFDCYTLDRGRVPSAEHREVSR
jgi:hypothetical protein